MSNYVNRHPWEFTPEDYDLIELDAELDTKEYSTEWDNENAVKIEGEDLE